MHEVGPKKNVTTPQKIISRDRTILMRRKMKMSNRFNEESNDSKKHHIKNALLETRIKLKLSQDNEMEIRGGRPVENI